VKSSSRFAVSVHVLCAIAWRTREGCPCLTSTELSRSVNTNAVVVRRLLAALGRAGLVKTSAGQGGGSCLARAPESITLSDIYRAVEGEAVIHLHYNEPSRECPVGRSIRSVLTPYAARAARALGAALAETTLARVLEDVTRAEPIESEVG